MTRRPDGGIAGELLLDPEGTGATAPPACDVPDAGVLRTRLGDDAAEGHGEVADR